VVIDACDALFGIFGMTRVKDDEVTTDRYCDFCDCDDCKNGWPSAVTSHAPTVDGRWICGVCYRYEVCLDADSHPCKPGPCEHRPELAGEWC
jgi:hypothetical protein